MTTEEQDVQVKTTAAATPTKDSILRDLQDHMVEQAEQLVRDLDLATGQGVTKGRTQASKALEVAQTAQSLSVFVNWIRYQAARERSTDFWSKRAGKHTSLAKGVTVALGELRGEIESSLPKTATTAEKADVVMQGVTRFLGYFRRALIGADFLNDIMLAPTKKEA